MVCPVLQTRLRTVLVVDPHAEDYSALRSSTEAEELRFEVFKNARMALRRTNSPSPEVWIVNMRLPDMAGIKLMSILHWLYPGVPVYLVSDAYREQDEIDARCAGAEMYLCKPPESSWLPIVAGQPILSA